MKKIMILISLIMILIGWHNVNLKILNCQKKDSKIVNDQFKTNQGEQQVKTITMIINNQEWQVNLYQNDTVESLINRLPLTIQMKELHGNEKYHYLDFQLPIMSESIDQIETGDLMLFGNNCLVLFYESFSTPYQYTKIGYIDNLKNIKNLVGSKDVKVTFQVNK